MVNHNIQWHKNRNIHLISVPFKTYICSFHQNVALKPWKANTPKRATDNSQPVQQWQYTSDNNMLPQITGCLQNLMLLCIVHAFGHALYTTLTAYHLLSKTWSKIHTHHETLQASCSRDSFKKCFVCTVKFIRNIPYWLQSDLWNLIQWK